MAVPESIPAVLGAVAVFATSALVAVLAILAHELASPAPSAARIVAVVSCALEGVVLLTLCASLLDRVRRIREAAVPTTTEKQPSSFQRCASHRGLWCGLHVFLCTAAASVAVAALIRTGKAVHSSQHPVLGPDAASLVAGASVTLGIAYAAQLLFVILCFVGTRIPATGRGRTGQASSLETGNNSGDNSRSNSNGSIHRPRALSGRVKSIPYSQTSSPHGGFKEKKGLAIVSRGNSVLPSADAPPRTPPGSSGGRSATDTMGSSIRSSLSHVIRPITSKTRLISPSSSNSGTNSQRSSSWRPASLAGSSPSPSSTYAARASIEDFDSWDTSAVDPQNRQTVLENSVSPSGVAGRFLETIPASPTTSRSPSPGTPLDLEPPRSRQRRSRSYSPATSIRSSTCSAISGARARSQSHSQSPPPPTNEAHIHPLFRSDSPTPPPAVSAGTIVTAAPNGGQIIADAQSLRKVSRMRSGSLPAVPSPLSRQGSFDDFGVRRAAVSERPNTGGGGGSGGELWEEEEADERIETPAEYRDEDDENTQRKSRADSSAERKMTPPIPDWILSAGARTSLSGYQSRKVRVQDGAP
ncbi:hypothetical protein SPI_09054 [Niveomyces insectorum RCEF 264]|uniref:Uncharacterized protein n=1 Tax=Niveomyces insectorum RCEF 264 TaxID=1081102 RepID=A0A162MC91_9HYPO|nr:hypothetical protein SPI_09054 [Niveomyces insectorum RCEF 264]